MVISPRLQNLGALHSTTTNTSYMSSQPIRELQIKQEMMSYIFARQPRRDKNLSFNSIYIFALHFIRLCRIGCNRNTTNNQINELSGQLGTVQNCQCFRLYANSIQVGGWVCRENPHSRQLLHECFIAILLVKKPKLSMFYM